MFSIKKEALIGSVILSIFLASDFSLKRFTNSKNIPILTQSYNYLTYPFLSLEQKLEKEFSIKYHGDKTETVIQTIYDRLEKVKDTNPRLLEYLKEITILTHEQSLGLEYKGLANYKGQITLRCDYSLADFAHELTHTKYDNVSQCFQVFFIPLFDKPVLVKGKGWQTSWMDGSREPRYGYVSPTATRHIGENVAQYIATFYSDSDNYDFWKRRSKTEFDYKKILTYLTSEEFITKEQRDKAIDLMGDK